MTYSVQKVNKLFSPITIGNLKLPNRIVQAPMATNFATTSGEVTEQQIAYYAERAKGGVGLITTESNYVSVEGRGSMRRLGLTAQDVLTGHKRLVEAVHKHGVAVCAQLHHAGSAASREAIGEYPVSCSATILPTRGEPVIGIIPRALRREEIKNLVLAFGVAATRAREAGFDAVQIHGAHGYLINQFLSPHFNKRSDEYGGTGSNRMRFLLEIVDEVRSRVGVDYPIFIRLSGEEYIDGGYKNDYIIEVVKELENHGANEVSLTSGNYEQLEEITPVPPYPEGCYTKYSEAVKRQSNLVVGVVGRIRTPEIANGILEAGKADLIYLGRELIADPMWPIKAEYGKERDIRPCIFCNQGCVGRMRRGLDIRCTVNYSVGRELDLSMKTATNAKKVLVVGGGPAGMEAARVAAERGHTVNLIEKTGYMGGQLNLASIPDGKEVLNELTTYYSRELARLKVRITLDQEVDDNIAESIAPDIVILATGSKPIVPTVKGIKLPHVLLAEEVLGGNAPIGETVAIIGGGMVGIEIAEMMSNRGKRVVIVEMQDDVLLDEVATSKKMILQRLGEQGVRILIKTRLIEVLDSSIIVERLGSTQTIQSDSVILSCGYKPYRSNVEILARNQQVRLIGDGVKPGKIIDAIHSGAEVASTF